MQRFILIILMLVCIFSNALAATYYVKWDSPGGNGLKPDFSDAYKTIKTALAARRTSGDIIEVSGGLTGHTYNEIMVDGDLANNVLLQGSIATGHNALVTIDGSLMSDGVTPSSRHCLRALDLLSELVS